MPTLFQFFHAFISGITFNRKCFRLLMVSIVFCPVLGLTIVSNAQARRLEYEIPEFYSFSVEPEAEHLMQDVTDYALERIGSEVTDIGIHVYNPSVFRISSGSIFISGFTNKIYFDVMFIRSAPDLDSLAGVVLHEIAHVLSEDMLVFGLKQNQDNILPRLMLTTIAYVMASAMHLQGQSGAAVGLVGGSLMGLGLPIHDFYFALRQEEKNADIFAMRNLSRMGYDASGLSHALSTIVHGWGSKSMSWYDVHPDIHERIEYSERPSYRPSDQNLSNEHARRVRIQKAMFNLVSKKFLAMNQTLQESLNDFANLQDKCVGSYILGYSYLLHEKPDEGIKYLLDVENNCGNHDILNKYAFTAYHLSRGYLSTDNIEKAKHYAMLAKERLPSSDYLKLFFAYVILRDNDFNLQQIENIVFTLPKGSAYQPLAWRLLATAYSRRKIVDMLYLSNAEFNLSMAELNMYKLHAKKDMDTLFAHMRNGFRQACLADRNSKNEDVKNRSTDLMKQIKDDMSGYIRGVFIGLETISDNDNCRIEFHLHEPPSFF